MASGKTDNLMSAILAHGKDPMTGEYLSPQQRKELFKKAKISGSKVFGTGGGGGSFKGGGGGAGRTGGLTGGALAIRSPGVIATNDVSQKLENILVLLKADADTEQKYRESLFEKQRLARERLLRGGAEDRLEGKDKERTQKVEKAKKGMELQIPFLEKLAKFLMIYLAGWTTDKLINMFSAKAEGNVVQFLKYRDVLINSLGKFFTPVANIANGFVIWIAKTTKRIAGFAAQVGKKVFTPFFRKIRDLAVGMLNKLKSLVQNPLKTVTDAAKNAVSKVTAKGAEILSRVPGAEKIKQLSKSSSKAVQGLTGRAGQFIKGVGDKLNPKQLLQKAFDPIKGLLGKTGGALGNGLKNLVKGNLLGMILGAGFDVRDRLTQGQSPTQAFLAGIIKGAAAGGTAGIITTALTSAIPGLGLPIGLLLGGYLGDKAGSLLASPIDKWFSEKKREPNEFDKWFTNWANKSDDTTKALLGWDTRTANAGTEPAKDIPAMSGAGTGDMTRVSPGGAMQNASALTPIRTGRGRSAPAVIPVSDSGSSVPQSVPNQQLVTDIPNVEPTNYDNPYLSFSYSVYNVLV
jgi:hypothetical protein